MAKKIKRKQKRKRARASKRLGFFAFIADFLKKCMLLVGKNVHFIILALFLLLIGKGIYNLAIDSEYFTVNKIEILCIEGDRVFEDHAMSIPFQKDINIFVFNLKKAERKIQQERPEIKNVRVNKVFPDKIQVFYEKRVPFCQLKADRYFLITRDAVVLPDPSAYASEGLLIVTGIYVSEDKLPKNRKLNAAALHVALKLIDQIKQTGFDNKYKIEKIDMRDEFNPIISLDSGTSVSVGKISFDKREPALVQVLADLEAKDLKPKSIDLRFDDVIVVPR